MEYKVLIIEDDEDILEMIKNYLKDDNYDIESSINGEEGIIKFYNSDFNIVIVDIMMPKLNGYDVIKLIREKSTVPILIISAKDSDTDKALGLGIGADDFITKPFSMLEFSSRIKALLRRSTSYSSDSLKNQTIKVHDLKIDKKNYTVEKNNLAIKLTNKEFEILKLFASNPNRVFTKSEIYTLIWKDNYYGDENIINVHIRRLREKIEDNPSNPKYIKTLWGIGYRLGDKE